MFKKFIDSKKFFHLKKNNKIGAHLPNRVTFFECQKKRRSKKKRTAAENRRSAYNIFRGSLSFLLPAIQ